MTGGVNVRLRFRWNGSTSANGGVKMYYIQDDYASGYLGPYNDLVM